MVKTRRKRRQREKHQQPREEEEEERRTIIKKKRKKRSKNDSENEEALKLAEGVQKARTQICVQLSALRRSQAYLDTYTLDGWRSSNQEKLKPIAELAKKREDIFFRKLKVRELFEKLNYDEKKLEKYKCKEDSDGEIECEDVVCCECGSGECNEEENDVVFCDGYCDLAYHMKCVKPPLKPEDIPKGDEGWLCPLCDCRVDVIYYLNLDYDQRLDIETCTHLDVFKKEQDMFDKGIIPGTARFHLHGENEEDVWPSDESEDEDFKEKNEKDDGKDDSDESLSGSAVVPQSSSDCDDSENSSSSSSSDSAIIIEGPRRRTKVDYVKLNGDLFGDAVLDGDEEEKQDAKVKPMADRRAQLAALVALNKKEKNESSSSRNNNNNNNNKNGKTSSTKRLSDDSPASPAKTKGTQRNGGGGNNRRRKRRGRETTTTTTNTNTSALLSSKSTKAHEKKKKKKMKMMNK
ncbi:unnamed protein product [Bathycoccus prasinos]